MNLSEWQKANNRYLAASLEWLRLRLERLAPEVPVIAVPASVEPSRPAPLPPDPRGGRFARWFSGEPHTETEVPLLQAPARAAGSVTTPALDERIKQAADQREGAAKMDPPPALLVLAERFGLSGFERDTLLMAAAPEFDPSVAALCARAYGTASRSYPTFALALAALDEPEWEAVAAHRPLRYARLVEVNQPGATPLNSSALLADSRIVDYLKGLNMLDERLSSLVALVEGPDADLSESQRSAAEMVLERLSAAAHEAAVPVVQLVGRDPGSKLAVARHVCTALGRRLFRMPADGLPRQLAEIETLARLWSRENFLFSIALYLDAENLDAGEGTAICQRFLARQAGLAFVGVRETAVHFGGPSFAVEVNKPTPAEQYDAWVGELVKHEAGPNAVGEPELLAGQFDLNLAEIREAADSAWQMPASLGEPADRLWATCRDLTRPRMDALAQRLEAKATWDDLVLPEEQMELMQRIAAQVRQRHKVYDDWGFSRKMNRGFGISVLFAGESGCGKTMAAEVIANDLKLNLYRIDLSAVVSRYLGDTEKNLCRLFDAAELGGVILFFDEADALFGKRSEVKDSHDRYANIEINYLLQRMEAFSGLAILATNMKTALDPAFMRRLRFIVNFAFPGPQERKLMWQKALPAETPKEVLDYERLARMNMTGGNIHSIALNAAFLAAEKKLPVTMPILLSAARTEMKKLEKPFSEAEFKV